ncbi:MAG: arginine repressor, partial [Clostridia bacterium]
LADSGRYKYVQVESHNSKISSNIIAMYRESVISVVSTNNLIVIRTLVGSANSAALLVDKLAMPEILGCIAGDDTLLIIA